MDVGTGTVYADPNAPGVAPWIRATIARGNAPPWPCGCPAEGTAHLHAEVRDAQGNHRAAVDRPARPEHGQGPRVYVRWRCAVSGAEFTVRGA